MSRRAPREPAAGYAVVDVETTGLSPRMNHRIAEIAIVHVSTEGATESSWSTLVNPRRDLGAHRVHGITAADARLAPTFDDLAGEIAARLAGRVFVAHNAGFDRAFLTAEFEAAGAVVPLSREMSICTMEMSAEFLSCYPRTLGSCCAAIGIEVTGAHTAMGDATATAALLSHLLRLGGMRGWADVGRAAARSRWPLIERGPVEAVHRGAAAASMCENTQPAGVRTGWPSAPGRLRPGAVIAISGETVIPRDTWEARANAAGVRTHPRVTRETALLAAADPASLSGKARLARKYGIPIVTEAELAALLEALDGA